MANSVFDAFNANTANGHGGNLFHLAGAASIHGSTFTQNTAAQGNAIINYKNALTIANSTAGGDCTTSTALTGSNVNNLIEDSGVNACGLTNGVSGNIIGQDPNLGTLTGSLTYFPINPPALRLTPNTGCSADSQNGVARPRDGDGYGSAICDIGAYEVPDTFAPTLSSIARADPNPTNAASVDF